MDGEETEYTLIYRMALRWFIEKVCSYYEQIIKKSVIFIIAAFTVSYAYNDDKHST